MQIGKGVLLVMLLLAPGAVSAQAAGYPERPVRMVVPFPPGGSTDFTARIVAQQMEKILGQPVVVENKVGNLGIAALQELANADAYTLMVGSVITNSLTPVVYRKRLPFNYDAAIQPVSRLAEFPSILVTRTAVPANTLKDFVEYARKTWGRVRNATDWIGSYADMDAVMFGKAAGIEVVNVTVAGGANGLLAALIDGGVDMVFLNSRTAGMAIKAGKVKALAVTGPFRLAGFPDVPTMHQAGFRGIGTMNWQGLFAPGGTPTEIVRVLHRAAGQALNSDEAKSAFGKADARVAPSASPEQFAAEIRAEMAQWERVSAEIKLDVD